MLLWLLLGLGVVAVTSSSSSSGGVAPGGGGGSGGGSVKLAPQPNGPPFPTTAMDDGATLPATSPDGFPWVFWRGGTHAPFTNSEFPHPLGLDANGTFWTYGVTIESLLAQQDYMRNPVAWMAIHGHMPPMLQQGWETASFDGSSSWIDTLGDAVRNYGLPALALVAAAVIPGIGGVLAAAILTAAARMAKGSSITDAVVQATADALPTLHENRAFDDAYRQASGLYKAGKQIPEVQELTDKAKSALLTPDQRTAYDQGLMMALAQKNQSEAIAWLKDRLPDKAAVIDKAMAHGGYLLEVAQVLGGAPAVAEVGRIIGGLS